MGGAFSQPSRDVAFPIGTAIVTTALGYIFFTVVYKARKRREIVKTSKPENGAPRSPADDGGDSSATSSDSGAELDLGSRIRVGVTETIGKRKSMEDASLIDTVTVGSNTLYVYAVFDGHGGAEASRYCKEHFSEFLARQSNALEDTNAAIVAAVHELESGWLTEAKKEPQRHDGSTLAVAVLNGRVLHVGNLGDSEVVVGRRGKPVLMTYIHNPSKNELEIERIEADGGRVHRNRLAHPYLNPQIFHLGVSGAIGDIMYKDAEYTNGKNSALTTTAHVQSLQLTDEDDFVVIACDGLWDVMSYEDCMEFVYECLDECDDPQAACDRLVNEAEHVLSSQDNITAMILRLPGSD